MTAVSDLLDGLEAARDAIGDSPAFRVVGFEQGTDEPEWVYARFDDGGQSLFAECYGADAAALIVASVNAAPLLVAALRAVLALADEYDVPGDVRYGHNRVARSTAAAAIRFTIARALRAES